VILKAVVLISGFEICPTDTVPVKGSVADKDSDEGLVKVSDKGSVSYRGYQALLIVASCYGLIQIFSSKKGQVKQHKATGGNFRKH
jgi:ribosomal protein S8